MNLRKILGGLAVALTVAAAPTAALAQRSEVVVLNQAKVIADSKAGKSIQAQIQNFAQAAGQELQAQGQQIQAEGQALQASRESLGEDELKKRATALMAKQQGAQQLSQIKQAELVQAEQAALAELSEKLEPIIRDVTKRRRAKVVLSRADVALMLDEEVDITDEVIAALDRTVTTIQVTKPDLVAQAQAAAAAQQGGGR